MKVIFAPSIAWNMDEARPQGQPGPDKYKLYELLAGQGIQCSFMDPTKGRWNPFSGKNSFLQSLDPVRALKIALFHRDVDVVVSVFEGAAASLGVLKKLLPKRSRLAMWDIGLTNWRIRNKVINFTLPRIDELLVLGNNQIGFVQDTYAGCRSIEAIGHYVDTDFYQRQAANREGYILSVGDDVGRDFPTLVDAVRTVDRPVKIKSSKCDVRDLPAHVEVLRARVDYPALRQLYIDSSIVVITSHLTNNACGVSAILEASAMGRPVIVTDNPGIRDFVIPDQTCLLVPANDPVAVSAAITRLLNDAELYRRLADGARKFAEENCSIDSFAKTMGSTLRRLASKKRK